MKQVNYVVGGVVAALVASASSASAQQVMWKDNPISGKVVGLTYGASGWNAAEAQAVAYGGHLVTIRSVAENQWLKDSFASAWTAQDGGGPWIGFTDAQVEGEWRWSSNEPISFASPWGAGEPNNGDGIEDWGHFWNAASGWGWNDAHEGYAFRSLIELQQRPARSWSWPTAYATGARPVYGCAFDMDGDGDVDYASPDRDSGQISLWRNNGTGVFTSAGVIGGAGNIHTVQPNDHDGDGDLDLYGEDTNGRLLLARNGGASWSLEQLAAVPACHGVTAADLNNDGRTDIITSSVGSDDRMRVFLRQSDGSLATPSVYGPFFDEAYETSVADLDGDGYQDVLLAGGGTRLLRGSSTGILTDAGSLGTGMTHFGLATDLNADGILELVVSRIDSDRVEVWNRASAGPLSSANYTTTQDLPCGDGPHWVSASDLDGDGDLDVVVPSYISDTVHIFRNTNGVLVQDHVLSGQDWALCNAVVDLNGDAKPDIITSNFNANAFSVHFNQSIFDCNGNSIDDPLDIASGFSTDCNSNGRPDSCDAAIPANDCNADSILDACQLTALTDCNNNARLDTCDLASGAPDCNGNQILDVCEPLTAANDCNGNGQLDYCELVAGTAPDCNLNSRPDSCDLAAGLPDCNLNQVPDTCDIGAGTSNDGDLNNIPDECSLDCNANGLLDTAECAQGLTADCNGNLVPDSCDLVAGVPDCNTNGVPDSCDVAGGQDCNANGQPDACDLAAGGSDCNGNQQLDSCELAAGGGDCNGNQQFDACELLAGAPDCNGNGALDACDIAAGAADCDGNQVPDACQPLDATSDCNANLILDVCDILGGAPDCNGNGRPDSCDVDTNGDQISDECQDGGTLYCFGDGAANSTPCPCGGVGAPRSGCPNSVNPAGGYLVATGLPSRIADTLVLRASQMPPVATVLYFQGTSQASTASGTIGTVFGDGLRCAAGAVVRVGFRTNSAGASEIPSGGSPALHIAGQIPSTGAVTRYYQGWYRDVNPSFCTANRYNLTNGVAVVWVP